MVDEAVICYSRTALRFHSRPLPTEQILHNERSWVNTKVIIFSKSIIKLHPALPTSWRSMKMTDRAQHRFAVSQISIKYAVNMIVI